MKGKLNERVPLYATMKGKLPPSVPPLLCFGTYDRYDKDATGSRG